MVAHRTKTNGQGVLRGAGAHSGHSQNKGRPPVGVESDWGLGRPVYVLL